MTAQARDTGTADESTPGHLRAVWPTEPTSAEQSLFLEGRAISGACAWQGVRVEAVRPEPGTADIEPYHLAVHDISIVVDQREDGSRYLCIQNLRVPDGTPLRIDVDTPSGRQTIQYPLSSQA